ncbi:MAG: GyrI-like domain-containing protein, partial [Ruminiclostridium sp.]|nr:GyrI-like domain-containing protein [Ruminiclostridium sp.]
SYMIADDYVPWVDFPANLEIKVIPAHTWVVFPCNGALPEALQSVNTKIWNEWLPTHKEYRLADKLNIELYTPACDTPNADYSEIWIPVKKK